MTKLTQEQLIEYGLLGYKSARNAKIETKAERKKKKLSSELHLQTKICQWLIANWPDMQFISDFSAGLYLPLHIAEIRSDQAPIDKNLDLMILEPVGIFHGAIIEIKTLDGDVYLKNGGISKVEHTQEQLKTLVKLAKKGYYTTFGVGEDNIKQLISEYLAGKAVQKLGFSVF